MIITVLATGAFLLFVLAGVLVFSKRRQNLEDEYQRTIPNLARARERRRLWAATTASAVGIYYTNGDGGGGCGGGGCGGGGCGGGGCGGGCGGG
jgi:hypothetical protein